MSYLDEDDKNLTNDILKRKEFQLLNVKTSTTNIIPSFLIKGNGVYLEFHAFQMFVENYINPNTNYSRLLIKFETGLGKTVSALSIAMNFIKFYQKQEELFPNSEIGSVFIIGFTQQIFRDELFKYSEFGFISREEIEKLNLMKKQSYLGNLQEIENLKRFMTILKKRLNSRKGNGFFKFIGYKELTNHLFIKSDELNLPQLTEEEMLAHIESGKILINKELLASFSNSLLICDEIHRVYNSKEKNNWGVALQTILNHHKSARAVFLSATPLNNSATEVIDLLNLLLPRQNHPHINKQDLFDQEKKEAKLRPDKIDFLRNAFRGRISFMRNRNPNQIATKHFMGESISGIDYLKFIRCKMSKFQYNTYKQVTDGDVISQDAQYIVDFAIPDPTKNKPYEDIGLCRSKEIQDKLLTASVTWKNKFGLQYNSKKEIVTGASLQLDHIGNISAKYKQVIYDVINTIKNDGGKMFIYHNHIHMSGTLFIQEIMQQNGILSEFDSSNDSTICSICGLIRKLHKKKDLEYISAKDEHLFQPARFVIVHSNLDKKTISRSFEKFNHINNVDGSKFMIIIGSKIIKESYSMNSVRNILITSRPDDISTLIQIIGRAARLNSHKHLPHAKRQVKIFIYTSQLPGTSILSYEELKYMEKIKDYKLIQKIEKIMHESAIDAYINYDKIWAKSDEDKNFELTILPYDKPIFKSNELNLSTFNAFHSKSEMHYIMYIIKRLFIEYSAAWKYDDLFKACKHPPFSIEMNGDIFSQEIFDIALSNLVHDEFAEYIEPIYSNGKDNLFDKLRDPDDKILIEKKGVSYIIQQVGEFYSMVPNVNNETIIVPEIIYRNLYSTKPYLMDIRDYLIFDMNYNYSEKKIKFINKWNGVSINNMELAICDFGVKFHKDLLEEIITYSFDIWTNPNIKKSEYHQFYFKMLYYYDIHKLVAWAHTISDNLEKKYSKYVDKVKLNIKNIKGFKSDVNIKESSGTINLLISNINRQEPEWISTGMIKEYNNLLDASNSLFNGIYKKKTPKKIPANYLPVGHFLTKIPRFYLPNEGWREDPTYILHGDSKENNIIIGYDSRSKTGLSIKFKLRSPVQNIKQFRDARMIERGAICLTKSKEFLKNIAKKLGIENISDIGSVDNICSVIRAKLLYNELKSRANNEKIRWFYFVYEENI